MKKGDKVKIKGQVGNYTYIIHNITESGLCGIYKEGKNMLKPIQIKRLIKQNENK